MGKLQVPTTLLKHKAAQAAKSVSPVAAAEVPSASGPQIEDVTPKFSDEVPEKRTAASAKPDNRLRLLILCPETHQIDSLPSLPFSFEEVMCAGKPAQGILMYGGIDGQSFFEDTLFLRPNHT